MRHDGGSVRPPPAPVQPSAAANGEFFHEFRAAQLLVWQDLMNVLGEVFRVSCWISMMNGLFIISYIFIKSYFSE